MAVTVRPAAAGDLPAIAAIYDHEVVHGHATFDTASQGIAPFAARLDGPDPLLVAETDEVLAGFAYSGPFRSRPAYDRTREVSIYLAADVQGQGIGRFLYDELLVRLDADGIHRVLAVVALPNHASEALHRACGFERVGLLGEVGRKFDRWIDVAIYERRGIR